jgi:hypothetical protein
MQKARGLGFGESPFGLRHAGIQKWGEWVMQKACGLGLTCIWLGSSIASLAFVVAPIVPWARVLPCLREYTRV